MPRPTLKDRAWFFSRRIRGKPISPEFINNDRGFIHLYNQIEPHSLLGVERAFLLYQFAIHSKKIPGDVAEVGVYRGGSAMLIAKAFENSSKTIHLFDTFSGMPEVDSREDDARYMHKGLYSDTDLGKVKNLLRPFDGVKIYKGFFPATATPINKNKFCFVHLDTDIFRSTKDGLEFFYPRMVRAGIIIVDDYKSNECKAVEKAVHTFFKDKKESPIHTTTHQCVVIKI